jgi:hypothetical protein
MYLLYSGGLGLLSTSADLKLTLASERHRNVLLRRNNLAPVVEMETLVLFREGCLSTFKQLWSVCRVELHDA